MVIREALEKLKKYGADTADALARFVNDEELYISCVYDFLSDENINNLGNALKTREYKKAFEAAHTLKGITGNLSLTPLYGTVCETVEALRASEYDRVEAMYDKITKSFNKLADIMK